MRASRVVLGLVLAAAAAVFALWLTRPERGSESARDGARVLTGLESRLNEVSELRISKGDGTRVSLRRTAGGPWMVIERDYPADTGKLRRLLIEASELEQVEDKTRDPQRYAVLGVEDVKGPEATGTLLEIEAGPQTRWSLIVGKPAGAREVYVRKSGEAASALARPQLAPDATAARWLDTSLVDLKSERVQSVALNVGGRSYVASRTDAKQTDLGIAAVPRGRELSSPSAPTALASALAGLQLDDVRPASQDAADGATRPATRKPAATSVVTTFDGLELRLTGFEQDTKRFVTIDAASAASATPAVATEAKAIAARGKGREFELASYKYEAIFKPLESLLKPLNASAPSTPAPPSRAAP